jgi:hypothetical protein
MTNIHQIAVIETVGKVTIQIRGKSACLSSDLRQLALLLGTVMSDLAFEGTYTVTPVRKALPGSAAQKGLSLDGTSDNIVGIGYQPGGNATRARYNLHTANAQVVFRQLKDYIGTAYTGVEKKKPSLPVALSAPVIKAAPVRESIKPIAKPEVYYTSDPEWMETFVLYLLDFADTQPQKQVSKDQVFDLIVRHTHYTGRFGVGPIYTMLEKRGHLVNVEGKTNTFTVVGKPAVSGVKKRKPVVAAAAPKEVAAAIPKKQKYLSDEEWMRSFMDGLRSLVSVDNGLISQTDLYRFIVQRTNQKKIAGTVYKILDGLKLRGVIITAGEKMYKFIYQPQPDTAEKAVAAIQAARSKQQQTFNGFAKFRLPTFAEGMFSHKQILDGFLEHLRHTSVEANTLKSHLQRLYPVSDWSHIQLLNYMVGQGYLLREKRKYSLGPKGKERLGLGPLKTVQGLLPAALTSALVKREIDKPPVVVGISKPLPTPPVHSTEAVTLAIAAGLKKVASIKAATAEVQARIDTATAYQSELRQRLAEPDDIEGDVQLILLERLSKL